MAPLVIAHRGASGYRPEHTLGAYRLAVRQGADFIEPDLVSTGDGVLVARHENEISETTDVAHRPEFASRRRRQAIDGVELDGWFTEDFTLAELRTLRARERLPHLRTRNTAWDGRWPIPTFDEVLALAVRAAGRIGRPVGVYPETKHPSHFRSLGLPLEEPLAAALARVDVPVFVQSFEASSLRRMRALTDAPLVQLLGSDAAVAVDDVASYAAALGVDKELVIPRDVEGRLTTPTSLVADAHAAGLVVHAWTFRAEPAFLPTGASATDELDAFVTAGVDGVFTDHPDVAVRAFSRSRGSSRRGAGTTSR